MPPAVLLVLPLDDMPLWVTICFLRAIGTREEAFVEGFGLDGKKILSVDSDLNKTPVYGE